MSAKAFFCQCRGIESVKPAGVLIETCPKCRKPYRLFDWLRATKQPPEVSQIARMTPSPEKCHTQPLDRLAAAQRSQRRQSETTPEEEWRPVRGYEGLYEVSDKGRLRRVNAQQGARKGRIFGAYDARVWLYRNHKRKTHRVDRLVKAAFQEKD